MDWSRTKTVMIFALILANLFVAYFIFFDRIDFSMEENALNASVNKILEEQGIKLSLKESAGKKSLPKLYAHSKDMALKKYVKNADTTQVEDRTYINSYVWVMSADNALECDYIAISDNLKQRISHLVYDSQDAIEGYQKGHHPSEYSKQVEIAQKFIDENLLEDFDKELFYVRKYKELYQVYFLQKFEDYLITDGYINIILYNGRVMKYSQRWYDVEKADAQIPADDYANTMYKLLREVKNMPARAENLDIVDYDFGYSFYDSDHLLQVKYGELTPYYIFKTEDSDIIKVDAIKVD